MLHRAERRICPLPQTMAALSEKVDGKEARGDEIG